MSSLFCFGLGYSAKVFAAQAKDKSWSVSGTTRRQEKAAGLSQMRFTPYLYDGEGRPGAIVDALKAASHVLVSIAPGDDGDTVIRDFGDVLRHSLQLSWVGYLSTVGVYGDWDGAWVDETCEPRPVSARSKARVKAEHSWLNLHREHGLPVHIFRLAGIYGPGRNGIEKLKNGTARRIVKKGQFFNRIHVEDIARTLWASIDHPASGSIYNVADNEPAPPQDVVAYAARLIGVDPPPEIDFDSADLSPMARSFYGECKRVSNKRIREELGVDLAYPTYREGLKALVGQSD